MSVFVLGEGLASPLCTLVLPAVSPQYVQLSALYKAPFRKSSSTTNVSNPMTGTPYTYSHKDATTFRHLDNTLVARFFSWYSNRKTVLLIIAGRYKDCLTSLSFGILKKLSRSLTP